VLAELYSGAHEDWLAREALVSREQLENRASLHNAPLDVLEALAPRERIHIIGEIKRKSPSKGPLAAIADPVELARAYESGGASAISVLTEQRRFEGSLADLEAVAQSVKIPVLRKDFLDSEYQVIEARAYGADWVLLIMAGLVDSRVVTLLELAKSLGMQALVEAHSAEEVDRAAACGADIIGVNARNLSTFELDRDLFGSLVARIPDGVIRVAESAVANSQDVTRYREQGADAVLVGEALVTGNNPGQQMKEFVDA